MPCRRAAPSPRPADTEATLNTLRHAAVMSGLRLERDADMLLEEVDIHNAAPGPAPAGGRIGTAGGLPLPAVRGGGVGGLSSGGERTPAAGRQGVGSACTPASSALSALAARRRSGWASSGGGGPRPAAASASAGSLRTPITVPGARHPSVLAATPPAGSDEAAQRDYWPAADQGSSAHAQRRRSGAVTAADSRTCSYPRHTAAGQAQLPPAKWSASDVRAWLTQVGGGRYRAAAEVLPPSVDGKALTRFPEVRGAAPHVQAHWQAGTQQRVAA